MLNKCYLNDLMGGRSFGLHVPLNVKTGRPSGRFVVEVAA